MNKMSIRKDDLVVVLSGKDKGKQGKILSVLPKESKVIVEGVNVATRHTKPRKQGEQGGILQKEAPIYACKVQKMCIRDRFLELRRLWGYKEPGWDLSQRI